MDKTNEIKFKLEQLRDHSFKVVVELLRDRKVGHLEMAILTLVAFVQIYGTLFVEKGYISWKEDLLGGVFYTIATHSQLLPFFAQTKSITIFWFTYSICIRFSLY